MMTGRPSRRALARAVWAAILPLAVPARGADRLAAALGMAPAPESAGVPAAPAPEPAAPGRPMIRWSDVCQFTLVDDKLTLRSDLTLDMIRGVEPEMRVAGLPGETTVSIKSRRFLVENVRLIGHDEVTLTVDASRSELKLELAVSGDGVDQRVTFSQSGTDFGRRTGRGGDARLVVIGHLPGTAIVAEANDLTALRRDHPHPVNRYLRPLLRQFGRDLFGVDPAAARQVLLGADAGPDDPTAAPAAADVSAVTRLVTELGAREYARRSTAAARLADLGPPGLAAVAAADRERLSAQQNLSLDLLVATSNPLPEEEARRLRGDVHFLLDCLYAPHESIRSAAADRLARAGNAKTAGFADVLALSPRTDADRLAAAVEKLRDELVPPAAR